MHVYTYIYVRVSSLFLSLVVCVYICACVCADGDERVPAALVRAALQAAKVDADGGGHARLHLSHVPRDGGLVRRRSSWGCLARPSHPVPFPSASTAPQGHVAPLGPTTHVLLLLLLLPLGAPPL
jgi:hypothetical protein